MYRMEPEGKRKNQNPMDILEYFLTMQVLTAFRDILFPTFVRFPTFVLKAGKL